MASCPTDDLFKVVTDRAGATGALVLDISRDVFRIVLNIYDGAFLRKLLTNLTHLRSIFPFNTPCKHQHCFAFLARLGDIKWEHRPEMD